jgi:hypothetical protein
MPCNVIHTYLHTLLSLSLSLPVPAPLSLQIDIQTRPTAAQALMHPYFRSTFIERLQEEGEVVEQDRKLEAVRDLFNRVRLENR